MQKKPTKLPEKNKKNKTRFFKSMQQSFYKSLDLRRLAETWN